MFDLDIFYRVVEIICGLFYFVFGVDGFLHRIPIPLPSPKALQFLKSLEETGYLLWTVKIIEIVTGLAFLFSFQGPLAWLLLTPVVFNILAFHFLLNRKEIAMPLFVLSMHVILFFKYSVQLLPLIQ